jgi:hypothetical protein
VRRSSGQHTEASLFPLFSTLKESWRVMIKITRNIGQGVRSSVAPEF